MNRAPCCTVLKDNYAGMMPAYVYRAVRQRAGQRARQLSLRRERYGVGSDGDSAGFGYTVGKEGMVSAYSSSSISH